MFVEFLVILFTLSTTAVGCLVLLPKTGGYYYWAPFLMLIPCYLFSLLIIWTLLYLFSIRYKKPREIKKQSKWASFWFSEALWYINHHARVKLIIRNKNLVPEKERFLLVCNHRSRFDPMIISEVYGKRGLAFVSKQSNFKIPVAHRYMWGQGFLAIDREDPLQSLSVMKKCQEYIKNDITSVGIFPEGTRLTSGVIGGFHEGVFNIALKTNAPIVVVTVKNTDKISYNFPWHKTKVILNVIKVIRKDEYNGLPAKEVSDRVKELMRESLE